MNEINWKKWRYPSKCYSTYFRIKMKQELIKYKGGKCQMCGFNKDIPGAFAFHHRDPKDKLFNISSFQVLNKKKLYKEVDKCDMLCMNCHAEVHDKKEERDYILKIFHERKEHFFLKEIECKRCKKMFKPERRIREQCKECGYDVNHKIKNPPTREELENLMKTMTWRAIGDKYGVSDNGIKKWAKKYGIVWKKYAWGNKI